MILATHLSTFFIREEKRVCCCFFFSHLVVRLLSEGVEPLPAGEAVCWFLCDFPDLLLSDFGPDCLTFTPRIICVDHLHFVKPKKRFLTFFFFLDSRKLEDCRIVHTYFPHLTSEYITMKSPSCSPFDLTKSPENIEIDFKNIYFTGTF